MNEDGQIHEAVSIVKISIINKINDLIYNYESCVKEIKKMDGKADCKSKKVSLAFLNGLILGLEQASDKAKTTTL